MQLPAGTKIDTCLPLILVEFFLGLIFFTCLGLDKTRLFDWRKQPLRLPYVHTCLHLICDYIW